MAVTTTLETTAKQVYCSMHGNNVSRLSLACWRQNSSRRPALNLAKQFISHLCILLIIKIFLVLHPLAT